MAEAGAPAMAAACTKLGLFPVANHTLDNLVAVPSFAIANMNQGYSQELMAVE